MIKADSVDDGSVSGRTAPARVAAAAGVRRGRSAWALALKIWLPVPILFLLFDATFNLYFWRIPKLTGPFVDYGYQFLYDVHRLSQPKSQGATHVLAFGSSIAGSFDPDQVRSLLETAEPSSLLQVDRLLVAGIKPSDWRVFFDAERKNLRPDVVVILLNLVDFLKPSFEKGIKSQVRYVLPPRRLLAERRTYAPTLSRQMDLALASVSNLYRYRKLIRSSLRDHADLAMHWLRAQWPDHGYGFYADGYTRQRFGLPIDGRGSMDLEYYVDPEWVRERGRVALDFSVDGRTLADRVETDPGWKTIHLEVSSAQGRLLEVAADSTWNRRAGGFGTDIRLLGLQLRQTPPAQALGHRAPPLRYPPVAATPERLRMGDAIGDAFATRFEEKLQENTEWAKRYGEYKRTKLAIRDRTFEPTGEYAEIDRLVAGFARNKIKVVIVNNPENPLLLKEYGNSPYYRAHVEFIESLGQKYPGVRVYNLDDALPAEDFNDWHHVNFIGTIKLGARYTDFVRQAIRTAAAACAPGSGECSSPQ